MCPFEHQIQEKWRTEKTNLHEIIVIIKKVAKQITN